MVVQMPTDRYKWYLVFCLNHCLTPHIQSQFRLADQTLLYKEMLLGYAKAKNLKDGFSCANIMTPKLSSLVIL
jgi:hypothetical protein